MELMTLVGVWALAFGHVSITNSLKMKGNDARIFGLVLIIVAAYGLPFLNSWTGGLLPKFAANNEALRFAFHSLIGAFAIYASGWVMTQLYPKLRIPSVNVSIKQARKAA